MMESKNYFNGEKFVPMIYLAYAKGGIKKDGWEVEIDFYEIESLTMEEDRKALLEEIAKKAQEMADEIKV